MAVVWIEKRVFWGSECWHSLRILTEKCTLLYTGENRRFEQQVFAGSVFESAFDMFSCNILGYDLYQVEALYIGFPMN